MRFADDDEQVTTGERRRRRRRPLLQRSGIRGRIQQRFGSGSVRTGSRSRRRRIFRRARRFDRQFCWVLHGRRPGTPILLSRRFRFVITLKRSKSNVRILKVVLHKKKKTFSRASLNLYRVDSEKHINKSL